MPRLVVIVGETASGKSALALEVARQLDGEIIAADSWTVYKGFDIGTAKPTADEQSTVPHHLLDVADPAHGFSAAIFKRLADKAIAEIRRQGKLPVLVGGTGLYTDSLLYDYEFLPPPPPEQRAALNALTLAQLLERAADMGLNTEGIDTRNKRRVIRLIENKGALPSRQPLRPDALVVGLRVQPEQLHAQIERRVDAMLAAGLEMEVRDLAERYGWDTEPMKGIGYREWRGYLAGTQSLAETRQLIIRGTLELAKKQRTWFKRNPDIHWFDNAADALTFIKSQV